MPDRIVRKWRPPLLLVLGGALAGVLSVALAGFLAMPPLARLLGGGWAAAVSVTTVLLVTAILAWLLWRLILRPVTALADRAHALRAGDATAVAPLPHYGTPELRDLGESVLGMAAALQNRESSIRSYTDHVTHELKAPLAAIRGAAELLDTGPTALAADEQRLVAAILSSAGRMETLLAALRRIAEAREPRGQGSTRLAAAHAALSARHPGLSITANGPDIEIPLPGDRLAIALGHIAENAAQHGATALFLETDGDASLLIGDDGPGIALGNRDRVFQPFFTTRREAGGTGMGLAIAASLLQGHGAGITLTDRQPGAWFRISF